MRVGVLNPRACDTMTDAAAFLSARCREAREIADIGSLKASSPGQRDRMGRNMNFADNSIAVHA